MAVDLFLSHISEERKLAKQLKTSLEAMFSRDVNVFMSSDADSILTGKNWLASVQEALKRAKAVIVLCSRASVQRSWVQFELGGAWMLQRTIIPVCHSGLKLRDMPLPLALLEGAEITDEGLRRLYDAVAHQVGTQREPDPAMLQTHLSALQAAEGIAGSPSLQFERFIDVVLPSPGRLDVDRIPDDTPIESNEESFKLFGLAGNRTRTWKEIEKAAQKTKDQRWLKELQACIGQASRDEDFRAVQAIYHNAYGSYQPQLSKKEFMPGGVCRFHVHLVETVVAPLTEVQNEFGLIATLLRLGLRFRYEVIRKFHRALTTAGRARDSGKSQADEIRGQLRNAISVIENDALSRGAENIDRSAVAELFVRDEDEDIILKTQDDWDEVRARLFCDDPAPGIDEMRDIVVKMRDINFQFMTIGTRRFHEMVLDQWRPQAPAVEQALPARSAVPSATEACVTS